MAASPVRAYEQPEYEGISHVNHRAGSVAGRAHLSRFFLTPMRKATVMSRYANQMGKNRRMHEPSARSRKG